MCYVGPRETDARALKQCTYDFQASVSKLLTHYPSPNLLPVGAFFES